MLEQVEINSKRWFDLTLLNNERFVDIENFEKCYQVSNYGRIKSLKRKVKRWNGYQYCDVYIKEKVLRCSKDKNGYLICTLNKNGKHKWSRVHILVAKAFIPNPKKLPQVNHKDLNKQNPKVSNLEWCTNQENRTHAKLHGAVRKGKKVGKINANNKIEKVYNNARECAAKENYTYNQMRYYIYKNICKNNYKYIYIKNDNIMA